MYTINSLSNENLSFGVAIVDSSLVIRHINLNFSSILQRDVSDLLGKKIAEIIPEMNISNLVAQENLFQNINVLMVRI